MKGLTHACCMPGGRGTGEADPGVLTAGRCFGYSWLEKLVGWVVWVRRAAAVMGSRARAC